MEYGLLTVCSGHDARHKWTMIIVTSPSQVLLLSSTTTWSRTHSSPPPQSALPGASVNALTWPCLLRMAKSILVPTLTTLSRSRLVVSSLSRSTITSSTSAKVLITLLSERPRLLLVLTMRLLRLAWLFTLALTVCRPSCLYCKGY